MKIPYAGVKCHRPPPGALRVCSRFQSLDSLVSTVTALKLCSLDCITVQYRLLWLANARRYKTDSAAGSQEAEPPTEVPAANTTSDAQAETEAELHNDGIDKQASHPVTRGLSSKRATRSSSPLDKPSGNDLVGMNCKIW